MSQDGMLLLGLFADSFVRDRCFSTLEAKLCLFCHFLLISSCVMSSRNLKGSFSCVTPLLGQRLRRLSCVLTCIPARGLFPLGTCSGGQDCRRLRTMWQNPTGDGSSAAPAGDGTGLQWSAWREGRNLTFVRQWWLALTQPPEKS